jgi:hypothetical protein
VRSAQAIRSFVATVYLVLVLANVACSMLGVYTCSLLLMRRERPSLRWARAGFFWNLAAVAMIVAFGLPLQQVCLFLLPFLGTQLLAVAGFRQDFKRRPEKLLTARFDDAQTGPDPQTEPPPP